MNAIPPVEQLLPHELPMLLLHRVVEWDLHSLVAEVDCANQNLFSDADGRVPTLVGVEYLVQAMGALAGLKLRADGLKPRIGFLLGVRDYQSTCHRFPGSGSLRIKVNEVFLDEDLNLGVFDGTITAEGDRLCSGQIKAIMPSDPHAMLGAGSLN